MKLYFICAISMALLCGCNDSKFPVKFWDSRRSDAGKERFVVSDERQYAALVKVNPKDDAKVAFHQRDLRFISNRFDTMRFLGVDYDTWLHRHVKEHGFKVTVRSSQLADIEEFEKRRRNYETLFNQEMRRLLEGSR